MQGNAQTQGWHTAQWGTWGWAETILKLIGLVAGIAAFIRTISDSGFSIGSGVHVIALVLLVLMSLASVAQLAIRFQQRETISMIFAVVNFLGHVGLLIAVLHVPAERTLPIIFGVFYLLGQLTKIQFLRVTGYTESGATSAAMARTAAIMAAIYALFVVFVLI